MDAINQRQSQNIELQASLHGVKFKSSNKVKVESTPLDEKRESSLDAFIQKRIKNGR